MSTQCPPRKPAHRPKCDRLVSVIDRLFAQLQQAKTELVNANAELATQIPVTVTDDQSRRLAELLARLLDSAVKVTGFDSAALCLLNEDATELDVRSSVGIASHQMVGDRRSLENCPADIKAISGTAVATATAAQSRAWKSPEPCESAVCVPVGSGSGTLGTLWVFSEENIEVVDLQIEMVQIIAGRIAAELERESIIRQALSLKSQPEFSFDEISTRSDQGLETAVDIPFDGWNLTGMVGNCPIGEIRWFVNAQDQIEIHLTNNEHNETAVVQIDTFTGEVATSRDADGFGIWQQTSDGYLSSFGPLMYLLPEQRLVVTLQVNPEDACQVTESTDLPYLVLSRN